MQTSGNIWPGDVGESFEGLEQHAVFPSDPIGEDLRRPSTQADESLRTPGQNEHETKINLGVYGVGLKLDERESPPYQSDNTGLAPTAPNKRQRLDSSGDQGSTSSTATSLGNGPRSVRRFEGPLRNTEQLMSYSSYQEGRISPRTPYTMSGNGESRTEYRRASTETKCSVCDKVGATMPHVIKSLGQLNSRLTCLCKGEERSYEPPGQPTLASARTPDDLIYQLDLGVARLNDSIHLVDELLASTTAHDARKPFPQSGDDSNRISYAPLGFPDTRRRSSGRDSTIALQFGSNLQRIPSPLSNTVQPQSPSQPSISNRILPTLPSPSSLNFSTSTNTLPPMSPSLLNSSSRSPHTAHLQELQHQLSTKSLAHQILLGEHEKLLAAFSRSQTRCSTLDKKSQVSDMEINELADERSRLQIQIESLEQQMSELHQGRDDALKQSALNGSQYMQIMSMSSKLQAQSLLDAKKWKSDRDTWQEEKHQLLAQIAELESFSAVHTVGSNDKDPTSSPAQIEINSSTSGIFQAELISLRKNKVRTDQLLEALKAESSAVMKILTEFGGLSDRLQKIASEKEIPR